MAKQPIPYKTYLSENESLLSRYAWLSYKDSEISFSDGYDKKDSTDVDD